MMSMAQDASRRAPGMMGGPPPGMQMGMPMGGPP